MLAQNVNADTLHAAAVDAGSEPLVETLVTTPRSSSKSEWDAAPCSCCAAIFYSSCPRLLHLSVIEVMEAAHVACEAHVAIERRRGATAPTKLPQLRGSWVPGEPRPC